MLSAALLQQKDGRMIDTSKILAMIDHWLSTEMHAYFGSDYGADLNSLLLTPLDSPVADRFISKMKKDIRSCSNLIQIRFQFTQKQKDLRQISFI